jgi:hypothetical protein
MTIRRKMSNLSGGEEVRYPKIVVKIRPSLTTSKEGLITLNIHL